RDRLPRDIGALGELNDRLWTVRREASDDVEAGRATQRGKHGRCLCELGRGCRLRTGQHRAPQSFLGAARYFSMSMVCAVQAESLLTSAFARRSSGIRSKPDSVIVSSVPPETSFSSNTTSVVGSAE